MQTQNRYEILQEDKPISNEFQQTKQTKVNNKEDQHRENNKDHRDKETEITLTKK